MRQETKEQRWATDYKKKMAKMSKSVDPKVWDYIYGSK